VSGGRVNAMISSAPSGVQAGAVPALTDLSHSILNTFNKDTVDNAQGVLNLLRTVHRLGTYKRHICAHS
jgi:hypothetical protein